MTTARQRVADAFAHRQPDRVPLWSIIENRPVYEHVLGAARVGDPADVALDDKLALHAEAYRALGIDMTRAQIWPPARRTAPESGTVWQQRRATGGGACSPVGVRVAPPPTRLPQPQTCAPQAGTLASRCETAP